MKSRLITAVATLLLAGSALLSSANTPGTLEARRATTPDAHGTSDAISSPMNATPVFSVGVAAQRGAPDAWRRRQNKCGTLSFYSVHPGRNPNAQPTHTLGKYKRLYFTTGEIFKGWVPVYSAGQEHWHTGWVRGECLVSGWPYPNEGRVIN